jgi:hypothetical protein
MSLSAFDRLCRWGGVVVCFAGFEVFQLDYPSEIPEREHLGQMPGEVGVLFEVENVCLRPLIRRTRRGFEQCPGRALLMPFVPLRVQCVIVAEGRRQVGLSCACRDHWTRKGSVACVSEEAETFFQRGRAYLEGVWFAGALQRAVASSRAASALGHTPAMFCLGGVLTQRGGIPAAEGMAWLRKGGEMRHAGCCNALSDIFRSEGCRNPAAALVWARKAASMGSGRGMGCLAMVYGKGAGVSKDLVLAVSWYSKAADCGDAYGMARLGLALVAGEGIGRNPEMGVAWLRKAAARGSSEAMTILAKWYVQGVWVPADPEAASAWIRKAASRTGDNRR